MKKLTIYSMMVMTLSMLITGCGTDLPNLSEEQTELVTEYAAGLLIKYNSIPSRSLLNQAQLEVEEKKEAEEKEKEQKKVEAQKAYLASQEAAKKDSKKENASSTENSNPEITDLASFYGIEGFNVSYTGYQLCQSYPDESRDDYFLAMDATEGKQLCILQFQVTNSTTEDKEFDMFEKKPIFYLSIDGGDKIPVQSTLLLDDFSSYKGVIETTNSEQMVLVFEVDGSVSQLGSLELTARYGNQKGIQNLQ